MILPTGPSQNSKLIYKEKNNIISFGVLTVVTRSTAFCDTTPSTIIIKPTRCTNFLKFYFGMQKLYMFRTIPLSIIRRFSPYTQQWYVSYRYLDSLRAGSGWNKQLVIF